MSNPAYIDLDGFGANAPSTADLVAAYAGIRSSAQKRTAASYTGLVAGQTYYPNNFLNSKFQIASRSRHIVREKVSSIQVVYANSYVLTSGTQAETAPGGTATITAYFEPSKGATLVPVTFSGAATGSPTNGGIIVSDAIACDLNFGDEIFFRQLYENASGIIFDSNSTTVQDYAQGEGTVSAVSGLSAATLTASTLSSSDVVDKFCPVAIIGTTNKRSFTILGDSRRFGSQDIFTDASGDLGETARSLGKLYAYMKLCISGDSCVEFIASHTNRVALGQAYSSDIDIGFAYNDFVAGQTAAQVLANIQIIAGYFTGKSIWTSTVAPSSTSTDNWATVANQTSTFAAKLTLDSSLRTLPPPTGITGVWDISDAISSGRGSNKFAVDNASIAFWSTADGVHESPRGYVALQNSGVVRI